MTAPTLTTATIPDLDGFTTIYGVPISCIGEDGDMIMLGHIDDRTAVAVARAYLRKLWTNQDEVDRYLDTRLGRDPWAYQRALTRDVLGMFEPVSRRYGHLIQHCDRWPMCQEPDGECGQPTTCQELDSCNWWIDCDVRPGGHGVFPVSYWAE